MAKTVEDYLSDPRILEDAELMEAPECIREIHAIRLKLQDETKNMTIAERTAFYNGYTTQIDKSDLTSS